MEATKQQYVEEELNRKAGGDPQKLAELKEEYSELINEEFVPGKASHPKNRHTKKTFTISTLTRQVEFDFEGKEYKSTVESAIFAGKNTQVKPLILVQFLGGNQKDVAFAHKLVNGVVEKEFPTSFSNGSWWSEYLHSKHLKASPSLDYQPWYKEEITTVFVTK